MTRRAVRRMPLPQGVGKMASPVRCRHCAKVYDLTAVTIVARKADCSIWHCPGCNTRMDDRSESGWTDRKGYDRIQRVSGGLDIYGRPIPWRA